MTTLIERLRYATTSRPGGICDEAANELEHLALDLHTERAAVVALTLELANARAVDIHSCHDGCTRSGCVAGRLREDAERYRWLRNVAQTRDWEYIGALTAAASDAEIDAAREATP